MSKLCRTITLLFTWVSVLTFLCVFCCSCWEKTTPLKGADPLLPNPIVNTIDIELLTLVEWINREKPTPSSIVTSAFPEYSGSIRSRLLWYLAANAKWRLTTINGRLCAIRRYVEGGKWEIYHQYYNSISDPDLRPIIQSGSLLIAYCPDGSGPLSTMPNRIEAVASDTVDLSVQQNPSTGAYESILILYFGTNTIEIECTRSEPWTKAIVQRLVNDIGYELSRVTNLAAIEQQKYDTGMLVPGSVKYGNSEMIIRRPYVEPGYYWAEAFVNPGEPGYTYIKAFELPEEAPIKLETNWRFEQNTIEYGGWSSNPSEQFYYNSIVLIQGYNRNEQLTARFELWFHPTDGGGDRKLIECIYHITGGDDAWL